MVNVDLSDFFGETGRVLDVAGLTAGTSFPPIRLLPRL